jgi:hypothetical protein
VQLSHANPRYLHSICRDIFDLRSHSLIRGSLLVLLSFLASILLSGFPNSRPNLFITIPAVLAILGTIDTIRCVQRRWNFYHAGVILCIYMDLLALGMIFFFLLYPYFSGFYRGY